MSYKFETMLNILVRIDKGDKTNPEALGEEFGMTRRSVERYIAEIRRAGVPIMYDRIHKRYVFEEGFRLQRSALNKEESLVFALAKSMLKQFGDKTGRILDSIEKKVVTGNAVLPGHIILGESSLPPIVEEHLRQLNTAILDNHQVEINYRASYKNNESTCRTVDPYYLLFKESMWYLRGFCRLRNELRVFALDKIDMLSVLDKHFTKNVNVLPEDELAGALHVVLDGEPVDVVLLFDEKVKPYLLRHKWLPSQENKELPDGRLEVKLRVNGFAGLKPWIYRWIPYVEVVEPEGLREEMKKNIVEANNKYNA